MLKSAACWCRDGAGAPSDNLRAGRATEHLVGQGRVELPTSRLSGVRSNHLSYWPGGREPLARPLGGLGPWKLNRTSSRPEPSSHVWGFDPKSSSLDESLTRGLVKPITEEAP
jgi:hypothetical protein